MSAQESIIRVVSGWLLCGLLAAVLAGVLVFYGCLIREWWRHRPR